MTYLHHDQAGSTRLLTGEGGEVTGAYTYDAYGNTTGHTGTATTPLGYVGEYTNADTGLQYLRARSYDPATGQFMNVDPIAAMTRAPYSYAGDNPLNASDPTGLLFGIELPSFEEVSNGIAGWGDTLTFGATKWVREELGINNVDECSSAYQAGGYGGLATAVLIPGDEELAAIDAARAWPRTADEMDRLLNMEGRRIPDLPTTPGRSKVTWTPSEGTKITFEQHPYHPEAPPEHTDPHWHLETPTGERERYLPGEPLP